MTWEPSILDYFVLFNLAAAKHLNHVTGYLNALMLYMCPSISVNYNF